MADLQNNVSASPFNLQGKKGLILGVANDHSIAWGCARAAHLLGAELVATCLNEKARTYVEPLTKPLGIHLVNCDVENPQALPELVDAAIGHFRTTRFCNPFHRMGALRRFACESGGYILCRFFKGHGSVVPFIRFISEVVFAPYDPRRKFDHHELPRRQ
jgi:hypothetical protein